MDELLKQLASVIGENAWLIKAAAIAIGIFYALVGCCFAAIMVTVLRGFWKAKP